MPTNLTKERSTIKSKGGNNWSYARCDATGSLLESWNNGVYREKTKFSYEKGLKPIVDESGQQVATEDDDVKTMLEITSLQDDVNTEKFLVEETEDTYFSIMLASGENDNTTNKIRYIPISRIESKYSVDMPGRRPVFSILPQFCELSKFPSSVPTWVTVASASFTTANKYYTVVSQSYSGSAPL